MIRIVKLHFKKEHTQEFIDFISSYRLQISSFPGCSGVEFLRDTQDASIFFTYSHWDHPESLEAYRNSELFNHVWGTVKQWFAARASAWSVEKFE